MKIAFYGSSILSSYWNGAASYYRGILRALAGRGHTITFYEPDAFERQQHRDIEPPKWVRSVVYPATPEATQKVLKEAGSADAVVKASGVGVFDRELAEGVLREARSGALRIYWDVDAAATLDELREDAGHYLHPALPQFDIVLTYGGGPPVVNAYREMGARACVPIYNALDPDIHHPVPFDPAFASDLAFLANRLPDREARVGEFFLKPAGLLQQKRFLLGGNGWHDKAMPANVSAIGHVGTASHNAFNCAPRAVLNVARDSMARVGYSPATRVFEAAGAGACLITDAWEGVEQFFEPGQEVLVARDGRDVAECLAGLSLERARAIGAAALRRARAEHTYELRGAEVDRVLRQLGKRLQEEAA